MPTSKKVALSLLAGVDFGSKLAGTTCLCYWQKGSLQIVQSQVKKDADAFLREQVARLGTQVVFLDAPLSLPQVYSGSGDDFFYRQADRDLRAMSPLFLGGLTARAMQLRHQLAPVRFLEVYPAALVRTQKLEGFYKRDLARFRAALRHALPQTDIPVFENWHQADSVLAWWSGWRWQGGQALSFGDAREGQVWV